MLAVYLTHVLPFRKSINHDVGFTVSEEFLWWTGDKSWNTNDLSKILKRESRDRIVFPFMTSEYRHTAVAIDRKHVRCVIAEIEERRQPT